MTDHLSIASITVSYNSSESLRRQLNALLNQTRTLTEIVVVDNCSRDSTLEMLKSDFPQVTVIALQRNVGIAGALAAGMSYALKTRHHDWAWLLDQDSFPRHDALEKLIDGMNMIPNGGPPVGMVSSLLVGEKGKTYPGLLWRGRFVVPSKTVQREPFFLVDVTLSSGSLVFRGIMETVGLPRTDFFIDFVDVEYCLRIRKQGYRIAMIRDSILDHTIGIPLQTQFLGFTMTWSDHVPWREYYQSRNFTYLVWHLFPGLKSKVALLLRQFRHGIAILLYSKWPIQSARMLICGFMDGRAGRIDNRFLPEDGHESASESAAFAPEHFE